MDFKKDLPLIRLGANTFEIHELTAVASLKIVLIHQKRIRAERDAAQEKLDEFLKCPNVRGMSRKVTTLLKENEKLHSIIRKNNIKY